MISFLSHTRITRLIALHFCPPFAIRHFVMIETDSSTVASGSTIQASLPQSSRTVGLRCSAAKVATARPAASHEVMETPFILSSEIRVSISFPCTRRD